MLTCDDFDTLVYKAKEYCDMLALVLSGPPLSSTEGGRAAPMHRHDSHDCGGLEHIREG